MDPATTTSNRDEQFEAIVAEFLEAVETGQKADWHPLLTRHPELADELTAFFAGQEHMAGIAAPLRRVLGSSSPGTGHGVELGPGTVLGGYHIQREIGRGGMGIVYEADQCSLGRHVALKILPRSATLDPRQLRRFQQEAQAAAQVQHPHIVPVYEVGNADGLQFYAMQLIDGRSLADWLRVASVTTPPDLAQSTGSATRDSWRESVAPPSAVRSSDVQPTATTPPWDCRAIARMGLQAAEALDCAHQHGVLHRDIKPANLLLDSRGDIWITDFGLAKSEHVGDLTQTGDVVGTLRFMAPERLDGWSDPRSDVYSLGLTLYELLTGRPAFDGLTQERLIQQILNGEPPRLRKSNPRIPIDLETIVLKAIAKESGQRYRSAGEMAEDLRLFLADRPIHARRVTLFGQLWRWRRRKPALAALSAALLVAVIGFPTALAVNRELANRRLLAEQKQTDLKRQEANANFRKARFAVGRFLTEVTDDPRLKTEDNRELRRKLLESARPFLQEFVDSRPDDPELQAERGVVLGQLALISREVGQFDEAIAYIREALAVFESLAASQADVVEHERMIGDCHLELSRTHQKKFQWAEAQQAIDAARAKFEQLRARDPENLRYQQRLADCHANAGVIDTNDRRYLDAENAFREAIRVQSALCKSASSTPGDLDQLAEHHVNLGIIYQSNFRGRLKDAADELRVAVEILETLNMQHAGVTKYQLSLANAHHILGVIYRYTRNPNTAAHLDAAVRIQEKIARQHAVPQYREQLARYYADQARYLRHFDREDDAAAILQKAESLLENLVEDYQDVPPYAIELGRTRTSLAAIAQTQEHWAEAHRLSSRATQSIEAALGMPKMQDTAEAKNALVDALAIRADALSGMNRHDEALADFDRLLADDKTILRPFREMRRAYVRAHLGDHRRATAEADAIMAKRASIRHDLEFLKQAACVFALSVAAAEKDTSLTEPQRAVLADAYAARSIELLTKFATPLTWSKASLESMRNDPDLRSLRSRPAFLALMKELEKKINPKP